MIKGTLFIYGSDFPKTFIERLSRRMGKWGLDDLCGKGHKALAQLELSSEDGRSFTGEGFPSSEGIAQWFFFTTGEEGFFGRISDRDSTCEMTMCDTNLRSDVEMHVIRMRLPAEE